MRFTHWRVIQKSFGISTLQSNGFSIICDSAEDFNPGHLCRWKRPVMNRYGVDPSQLRLVLPANEVLKVLKTVVFGWCKVW